MMQSNRIRIVTFANEGYVRAGFVLNWLESLRRVGLSEQAEVFVDGVATEKLLSKRGVKSNVWRGGGAVPSAEWAAFGSESFRGTTLAKLTLVANLLREGSPILFSDCDLVFLRDPLERLMSVADPETVILQSDWRCGSPDRYEQVCTGFFLIFPGAGAEWLLDITRPDTACFLHDQELLQDRLVVRREFPYLLLPEKEFPNGSCLREDPFSYPSGAYIVHFNFLLGGEKLIEMRQQSCWYVRDGLGPYLSAAYQYRTKAFVDHWKIRLGAAKKTLLLRK